MFGFLSGARDALADAVLEAKDVMFGQEEASDGLLSAKTPPDRWFTPVKGWPTTVAPLPEKTVPDGYTVKPWEAPAGLCPTAAEEPDLFGMLQDRPILGKLRVEVLEAEELPNSVLQGGIVDPYVLLVFESSAARTSQVRNDRTPRWGADAPRAFEFNITCPFSALHVAVLDEDRVGNDDPLGLVVIDVSQFASRTTYDCWWPLQYGMIRRHKRARGSVRLRVSVVWHDSRQHLLSYMRLELPTFVVPFVSEKAKQSASFAVQGRNKSPYHFRPSIFFAHVNDLRGALAGCVSIVLDFFFWRWPFLSAFALVLWQALVSYPTMLPACFTMFAAMALLRGYIGSQQGGRRNPLASKLYFTEMCAMAVQDSHAQPRTFVSQPSDESDESELGEDSDEEMEDQKRMKIDGGKPSSRPPTSASAPRASMSSVSGAPAVDSSTYELLPTFMPEDGSLQQRMDEIWAETDQRVRAEFTPTTGFTLNPVFRILAPILGPVQAMLGDINMQIRLVRRVLSWEDRILTFQAALGLTLASVALVGIGVMLMYVPWLLVFAWTFRLVGILLFGPHMILVGRHVRRRWADFLVKSQAYANGSNEVRREMVAEHEEWCTKTIREMVQLELHSRMPPVETLKLEAKLVERFPTVMVRARPTTAKMRYIHRPNPKRSYAYPSFPSEDRPPLETA